MTVLAQNVSKTGIIMKSFLVVQEKMYIGLISAHKPISTPDLATTIASKFELMIRTTLA